MNQDLYSDEDKKIMNAAENGRVPGGSRVEEIKKFAHSMGIKKIGIAHCVLFTKETEMLIEDLSRDFEVVSVGCKVGAIPSCEILGREAKGVSCNPAGQAGFLAENNTELNISMGLCIGHDMVFNSKSKTLTTTLLIKDRKHKHNTYKNFENTEA